MHTLYYSFCRIKSQVPTLGSQLSIRAVLTDAYKQATCVPYGYLVVDYSNKSELHADDYCLRSNIFPNDLGPTICYVPK